MKIMPYRLLKIKNNLLKYYSTEKESEKKLFFLISPYLWQGLLNKYWISYKQAVW